MGSSPVVSLKTGLLREALYESALRGIEEGAALELVDGLRTFHINDRTRFHADAGAARRQRLSEQIASANATAKQARANANAVTDPDLVAGFLDDAKEATAHARRLAADVERLKTEETEGTSGPYECDGTYVANAIANLAALPVTVDQSLNEAAKLIVSDLRITDQTSRTIDIEWWLRFPAPGGVARLGPLTFSLPHRTPLHRRLPLHPVRFLNIVDPDIDNRALRATVALQRVRSLLTTHGFTETAAATASISPIPEVADALASHVAEKIAEAKRKKMRTPGSETKAARPPGSKTKSRTTGPVTFADHVVRTYRSKDFAWTPATNAQDCTTRQAILDAAAASGGTASVADIVEATGLPRNTVTPVLKVQVKRGHRIPATIDNPNTSSWPYRTPVPLVTCMHCSHLCDFAVATPEIPDRLLCTHCMRMPRITDSPVFPDSYLLLREPKVERT